MHAIKDIIADYELQAVQLILYILIGYYNVVQFDWLLHACMHRMGILQLFWSLLRAIYILIHKYTGIE